MRNKQFDLLRFVAAILVIVSHSYDLLDMRALEPLNRLTNGRFIFSDIGIYIFFIISGYLIKASCNSSETIMHFATKRFLRIFPALITLVVLTVLLFGPLISTASFSEYFSDRNTYLYFINVTLIQMRYQLPGVFKTNPMSFVNGSLWTLPYEALMYLIIAINFILPTQKAMRWFNVVVATACFAVYISGASQVVPVVWLSLDKFGLLGALFACGMLIYDFSLTRWIYKIPWLFIILANFYCLLYLPKSIFQYLVFPILIFKIVNEKETALNKLTAVGDVSYGMYIYAFLIQQFIISRFSISPILLLLATILFAWLAGLVSWKLVEQPALRWKNRLVPMR